ncbi:hypothetical protein ACJJTC_018179 [Scirpophaga incertulas]
MITMWKFILLVACACDGFSVKALPSKMYIDDNIMFENVKALDTAQFSSRDDNPYRLPNTTRPIHYTVQWKTNITPPTFTFSGSVNIDLQATQPNVKNIVIHSIDLNIESVQLQLGNQVINQTHSFDLDYQFLIITLVDGTLNYDAQQPVNYRLSISYNAPMRTDMVGIYRSWYSNFGDIHWMAASKFSSTYARSAFPCYDEPSLKATFDVIITRQNNFKSWSNMELKEKKSSVYNGYEDDVYYTTPLMSTYLLAMIVAEYDSVAKTEDVDGAKRVVYELIARPEAIRAGQGNFMYNLGQEILNELSNYTGIDYYGFQNFMKLTHAAIAEFRSGAMENWGLFTYRETSLLYDEYNSGVYQKQFDVKVVAHETAHSWFGNLVTVDWWDALWLSEGFAVFFQYLIADKVSLNKNISILS